MLTVSPTSGLAADSGDANNLTWNFNSGAQAFDFLERGPVARADYDVTSSDGHGGSDTQEVQVTINGTADDAATDLVPTRCSLRGHRSTSRTDASPATLSAGSGPEPLACATYRC